MLTSSYPRNDDDFAGTFVRSLAEHIYGLGHQVHVLAANDPEVRPYRVPSKVKISHFEYAFLRRLHVLGYARSLQSDVQLKKLAYGLIPVYVMSGLLRFLALHSRERFDLLHAHWVIPCGAMAAMAARIVNIPLVISLHGSDVYVAEGNRVFGGVARLALAGASQVTACSDDLRHRAIKIGAAEPHILTIPYGVDPSLSSRSDGDSCAALRDRLGIGAQDLVVLGIGRLVKKKGFAYLVEAAEDVIQNFPGAKFIIAGDGDEKVALERLAHELGLEEHFRFPGAVPWPQVPGYLAVCDVFVVPSIQDSSGNIDGLPNVLLEAMACGKPVVASRTAGIPQVLTDGEDGLLVGERSPEQLALAIKRLLNSGPLRDQVGQAGRKRVLEGFSWSSIAGRFVEVYQRVVSGR